METAQSVLFDCSIKSWTSQKISNPSFVMKLINLLDRWQKRHIDWHYLLRFKNSLNGFVSSGVALPGIARNNSRQIAEFPGDACTLMDYQGCHDHVLYSSTPWGCQMIAKRIALSKACHDLSTMSQTPREELSTCQANRWSASCPGPPWVAKHRN